MAASGAPPPTDVASRRALRAKGQAMAPLPGSDRPRFPIRNASDLDRAIRAVGRASGSHAAVRAYIIRRAKALGLSSRIPDNWTASGGNDNDGD
jgi:hypothetical protein